MGKRLKKQMEFILEVDKLKNIFRVNKISDGTRRENDAEHSWHLAMMAFILQEYAYEPVDLVKVMKMVLIHDIVEIDAGDTFYYDVKGNMDKREREEKAADRIFSLLPEEQRKEMYSLWDEFEEMATPESKYAAALDRIEPVMMNYVNGGGTWHEHNIALKDVIGRNSHIKNGAPELWDYIKNIIDECVEKGILKS